MELLNLRMAEELARRYTVWIVGPKGASAHVPVSVRVSELKLKPLALFLLLALWRTLRCARSWKPETILAGSGLTAPVAYVAARVSGAKTAVYLHGLDVGLQNRIYRLIWMPAIRRMDHVIANSQATAELALNAGVNRNKIDIVHPGVDLLASTKNSVRSKEFRDEQNLNGKRILLSVGRLTERKGLREFVQDVLPKIVAGCPAAVLVIIGDAPVHSLHAKSQTPESIQAIANSIGIGTHLRFMGVITDREQLAAAYEAADVHVFPVRRIPGDPEGFGMVAVEAASFGLATVAYATGGIVDAVSDGVSGHLVAPGDSVAFVSKVLQLLQHPLDHDRLYQHAAQFAWPRFGERLLQSLQKS